MHDADEILVFRGALNCSGPLDGIHVPMWYPVHGCYSFTNSKAYQLVVMEVLGWCSPVTHSACG